MEIWELWWAILTLVNGLPTQKTKLKSTLMNGIMLYPISSEITM